MKNNELSRLKPEYDKVGLEIRTEIGSRKKLSTLLLFGLLSLTQCQTKDINSLQGTWKVDSVYSFYNGFDMTSPGQEPLYHFQPDGRLRMTKDKEYRYFFYKVQNDSLIYSTLDDKRVDGLLILDVNDEQLILKKSKSLLFMGGNQERYEIKYFSRVN
jgi:hypothetical protein